MGVLDMTTIQDASFVRLGYSGDQTFAEVEVHVSGHTLPLVATYKQEDNGRLTLVNVTEKHDDHNLDWYENNLHDAYPSVLGTMFTGDTERQIFAEEVLKFKQIREKIEDTIYYGD
jgi:hypothetical protein